MAHRNSWNLFLIKLTKNEQELIEKDANSFANKWRKNTNYLKNERTLLKALEEYNNFAEKYSPGGAMRYKLELEVALDQSNTDKVAKLNKSNDFYTKIVNKFEFFTNSLSKIEPKIQKKFMKSNILEKYKEFLRYLFQISKYTLSEKEEVVINKLADISYGKWTDMVSEILGKAEREVLDSDGKKKKMPFNAIIQLVDDSNTRIRSKAAKEVNNILEETVNTGIHEINAVLEYRRVIDEMRGAVEPDELSLVCDNIDRKVVDALRDAVSSRYNIVHRFYKLKADLLNKKTLSYFEKNIQYGSLDKTIKYEDAQKTILRVFSTLNKEFYDIAIQYFSKGQVDAFPKKGKTGGAFCTHHSKKEPTYILLNYSGKITDVTTIAHEFGHGINNELCKIQPEIYFGNTHPTAEVASTFMEDYVFQDILSDADEKTKLALLMCKLNDDVATIFRQIAIYNFELDLHNAFRAKRFLSAQEIGEIFLKHMKEYCGKYITFPKGSENWWLYIDHIRRYFYVYSYSSGALISKALQNKLREDGTFIKDIKKFLSTGVSRSPRHIFRDLGIDIADKKFWNSGLDEVESLLIETETLVKKIKK